MSEKNDKKHTPVTPDDNKQAEFMIHRLFVKDISFESPDSPDTFKQEWKPVVDLAIDNNSRELEKDLYEATLKVTVTTKLKDKVAFVAEVKQAGLFMIKNFTEEQKEELLGSFCPSTLFPYVREVISDVINRGGFPPLYLAPINFDAIYNERKKQKKSKDTSQERG
jgi:preprotein translocase subunit SecB